MGGANVGAGAAGVLWIASSCLLIALIVQCCRNIVDPPGLLHGDSPIEEDSRRSSRDLIVIACVKIVLAIATLFSHDLRANRLCRMTGTAGPTRASPPE